MQIAPRRSNCNRVQEVEFQVESERETARVAGRLAAALRPGDVVGLCGDLGAGKTFFAAAVARALGVPDDAGVSSPSFTIVNHYDGGRLPLDHLDLYRLEDLGELYELGLWEIYDGDGACLVEWCDRFDDLWPEEALVVRIELGEGERRRLVASGRGRGARLVRALAERGERDGGDGPPPKKSGASF